MRYDQEFYSSKPWKDVRNTYLALHPKCGVVGCSEPSQQVDHIISRKNGGDSFNHFNLTASCTSHHSSKTVALDGGFGRSPKVGYVPIVVGCNSDGKPKDPRHPWNKPKNEA